MGRVYCIEDAGELTLIDAGLALAAPQVLDQLRIWGKQPGDVKHILVTHAHSDHVGGLPALKRATGAEVICSATERAYTEGKEPTMLKGHKPGPTMPGTPVDRVVSEGELLDIFGGLEVIACPGHSPGQIAFWQSRLGILICGDAMLNALGLRLPLDPFTADMAEARRSVAKLAQREARIACFGHGPALMNGTAQKMRAFAERVK